MTNKQRRFIEEYLVDLNATQAAIRAGYSKKTANRIASENLSKLDIQKELKKALEDKKQISKITAGYILDRLKQEAETCVQGSVRIRALELLGKHLGLFTEKIDLTSGGKAITGFKVEIKNDSDN